MTEYDSVIRTHLQTDKYRDIERTKRDALEVLGFYRGLKPTNEQFVFNNGVNKTMLALKGTIPIRYKGNTYNIPIYIWLMDTHPYNAPMVFVKPTSDMKIKVSRHVDHNGKVYLPYLHDWKHDSSDLLDLIQVLIITFQEQPPVYAVQSSPQPQPQPVMPPMNVPYPTQNYATPYPPITAMPMPPMSMPSMPQPCPPTSYPQPMFETLNVRTTLMSAAEEKLRRRLEDIYLAAEIERKTGEHIKVGKDRLEVMMRRLEEENATLQRNMEVCRTDCVQLQSRITESEEDKGLDIDEAIQAPTPLHKQIVHTFAEEAALEDTIYYLGESFRSGKMDLETFQKHIRVLARKQFTLRLLLQKCRQKAGLAG